MTDMDLTIGHEIVERLKDDRNHRVAAQRINEVVLRTALMEAELVLRKVTEGSSLEEIRKTLEARIVHLRGLLKSHKQKGLCAADDESEIVVRPPIVAETEDPGF